MRHWTSLIERVIEPVARAGATELNHNKKEQQQVFPANVLKVLIATPGDTGDEVDEIIKSIHSWNGRRAEAEGVILLPRFWKFDAVPLMSSGGPQSVIDSQLVDDADIVIAVFDSRLGTATPTAVSGTAHEIERTAEAGKPVHVYFSDEPVSRNADPEELARLNKFRAEMEAKNLLGVYVDPTDLGYQVREAVEHDIVMMDLGVSALPVAAPDHAMPRLRYDGFAKRLIAENHSTTVRADEFTLDIPDGHYLIDYDGEPLDLLPQADARWRVTLFMGSDDSVKIKMRWLENGEPQEETQTVFLD